MPVGPISAQAIAVRRFGAVALALAALTACGPFAGQPVLEAGESRTTTCVPAGGDGAATVGATVVTAEADTRITGVRLIESENLSVIGWYLMSDRDYTGAARGFDETRTDVLVPAGESRAVEVGLRLDDVRVEGSAESVVLEFDAGAPGEVAIRSTLVVKPEDRTCGPSGS